VSPMSKRCPIPKKKKKETSSWGEHKNCRQVPSRAATGREGATADCARAEGQGAGRGVKRPLW